MHPSNEASEPAVLVLGVRGFLEGESRLLRLGEELIVGRGRAADLSVKRAPKFTTRPDRLEVARSERFLCVSRRHVRIQFLHPGLVEIEDLSSNGTFLDGRRVDRVGLTDLRARPHDLNLGGVELLRIEWRGAPAASPPPPVGPIL
ncbi:MAG: FHA domain-containing protein [Planctomycetaceae bacterium]